MTNLELIEYMKICTGKEIVKISDYEFIENVLKSEISIKDIIINFEKLGLDYRFKMNFLRKLYKEDDKTIREVLQTMIKLIRDYRDNLGNKGLENLARHFKNIFGYQCNKNVIIWDLNRLRIIKTPRKLKLGGVDYIISCYKDEAEEKCMDLKTNGMILRGIKAITFKDNDYRLERKTKNWLEVLKNERLDFIIIPITW